jgi:hypothetical protein
MEHINIHKSDTSQCHRANGANIRSTRGGFSRHYQVRAEIVCTAHVVALSFRRLSYRVINAAHTCLENSKGHFVACRAYFEIPGPNLQVGAWRSGTNSWAFDRFQHGGDDLHRICVSVFVCILSVLLRVKNILVGDIVNTLNRCRVRVNDLLDRW